MLFGLVIRSGAFAITAYLVFLLSQHVPQLDLWDAHPRSTVFEEYRNGILAGLERVRTDLRANGTLLVPARDRAGRIR